MNNEQHGVKITFVGVSAREASLAATELRTILVDVVGDELAASLERDNQDALDAGSTLMLLFGTPAAIAIAAGIRAFLGKRPAYRDAIMIKTAEGDEFIAAGGGIDKLDAHALVEALQRGRAKGKPAK